MNALEPYLQELRAIRSSGAAVQETAYYPALANLLNEVGKKLKVRCIIHLKDTGAGLPDGGLFTEDQIRSAATDIVAGAIPARGAIEAKPTSADAWRIAETKQVKDYWARYRQVLVTNYRDFLLIGADAEGNRAVLETYRLARDEQDFWRRAAQPRKFADQQSDSFEEFLKRTMLYQAPLATPKDLAWLLASYAREAKFRIETGELPALAGIRTALEEALGLKFEGVRGDHFFRSALIQTLFYGIFSAWVLWSRSHLPTDKKTRFEWGMCARYLRVPILRKLFHEVAEPGQLETMNLPEVLDWSGAALNRVDRASFFAGFEEGHAVQYFYEPFLEAFDPELRKDLGVWYTPVEIVKYMVARIDAELRNTLNVPDGLADPNVYVLDPCCGTGAYLVEVLRNIAATLKEKGGDDLLGNDLKRAALERVFGFEILPAPFVVAHLQLGLLLQSLGAPLSDTKKERAGVFLTNSLTGWEPPKEPKKLPFLELEEERDAADEVKRERPILVILGNPPYNSFAGVTNMEEERGLTEAYRTTKAAPAPQGQGLNDLYVRFFRMAERRIVEKTGKGIVSFISNYSWLDGLSFTGMRERYLEVFDRLWIDNLHGDRIITEYAPDGRTSETVFAMGGEAPGIKIGTAITLALRAKPHHGSAQLLYRDMNHAKAAERRAALLSSLDGPDGPAYEVLQPELKLGLPFKPCAVTAAYFASPLFPELFCTAFPGVKTSRDDLLVDIDRDALVARMQAYFDPEISAEEMMRILPRSMEEGARFQARQTRAYLVKRGFKPEFIVRYAYRPFDLRWLYWEPETKLLDEKRSDYYPHVGADNLWLVTQQRPRRDWSPPQVVRCIGCIDLMDRSASFFPLKLSEQGTLLSDQALRSAHETPGARRYLDITGSKDSELFFHAVAVLHSPAYAKENAGALRQDWPRVPLPGSRSALLASADLGHLIARLLDPDCRTEDITNAPLRPELRAIGLIRGGAGQLDPDSGELEVTAGWGYSGKRGVTMPAQGKVIERPYDRQEYAAIEAGSTYLGLTIDKTLNLLGETTLDVYLNENAYWKNIPMRVWDYTIGGYQVIKKWLSYREKAVLGRSLTVDEARHVTEMARRIAAILLLGPALDVNYQTAKRDTYDWSRKA